MNRMNKIYRNCMIALATLSISVGLASCEEEALGNEETPFAPYVLSLGITSNGATTYYVVTTADLMSGTINAVGKGIEQNGYRDYDQGGQTVFSIGGLGLTSATGIVRGGDGYLYEKQFPECLYANGRPLNDRP